MLPEKEPGKKGKLRDMISLSNYRLLQNKNQKEFGMLKNVALMHAVEEGRKRPFSLTGYQH